MKKTPGLKSLGPNRWLVRVTVVMPDGSRRDARCKVTGNRADALQAQQRLRRELEAEAAQASETRLTLGDYAALWLKRKAPELKPSTAQKYVCDLERHILPVLGCRRIEELRPKDIASYLAADKGSANNRRNRLALLRQLARDALADGFTAMDFVARVRAPRVPTSYTEEDPNLLSPEELVRLLEALPPQWRCIVYLLALTGLRWGEVSGLRWDDVDLGKAMLRVRRTNWKGLAQAPKTDAAHRVVPLADPLPRMLADHRRQQIAEQHPGLEHGLVFPTVKGTLHRGTPLRKVLDRACKAAGIRRITTHGFRRTWNNLARQLADRMVVRSIVGHASEAMTEHYSWIALDEKRAAAEAVAKLVRGAEGIPGSPANTECHSDVALGCGTPAVVAAGDAENPEGFRGGATRI